MIAVFLGTTGELIKLAPVLHELRERGSRPLIVSTGQQVAQLPGFLEDFGLPQPDLWVARGHRGSDLDRKREIPPWAATVAGNVLRHRGDLRRRLHSDGKQPFVMVHGDTMTTVLGSLAGRALRAPVAHVEAGMRSGDWRNPFPEELNRRIAARFTDVHFAPGPRPVGNLEREGVKGTIVDTRQNTIRDALDLVAQRAQPAVELPDEPFGLVSIHRFELIEREALLAPLLELLAEHAQRTPLLFVDHSTTAAVIDASPRLRALFDGERFRRIPRQPYLQFIGLLQRSRFLVSDSGGSQEECAFLGLPCVIHRAVSEHDTGLDGSVVLSKMDLGAVREFLADPERHRIEPQPAQARPSEIICDELARRGAL